MLTAVNLDDSSSESHSSCTVDNSFPLLLGEKLGRYDVVYQLSEGGMAKVYVGRLGCIGGAEKLLALKVIHPHLSANTVMKQMFLDEAKLAIGLSHPHVAEVYEIDQHNGQMFISEELVLGQDLKSLSLRSAYRHVSIPQGIIAFIFRDACLGLHAAHEHCDKDGDSYNLVHRDITPRNIIVSYDGFTKIIDFGIAWAAHGRAAVTKTGILKGTLGYMSPEQMRGEELDRRSDIFTLGVGLYLLLSGMPPFGIENDHERNTRLLSGDSIPIEDVMPEIDPQLAMVVTKAINPDPTQRYQTAEEMAEDLGSYLFSLPRVINRSTVARFMKNLFSHEMKRHEIRYKSYCDIVDSLSKSDYGAACGLEKSVDVQEKYFDVEEKALGDVFGIDATAVGFVIMSVVLVFLSMRLALNDTTEDERRNMTRRISSDNRRAVNTGKESSQQASMLGHFAMNERRKVERAVPNVERKRPEKAPLPTKPRLSEAGVVAEMTAMPREKTRTSPAGFPEKKVKKVRNVPKYTGGKKSRITKTKRTKKVKSAKKANVCSKKVACRRAEVSKKKTKNIQKYKKRKVASKKKVSRKKRKNKSFSKNQTVLVKSPF